MKGNGGFPVRVRFAKRGKVRFISARDVARALERAFRIEQLPLAFTEGFSPRPKVSFGLALSVGHESDAEYLDVELTEAVDTAALAERLTPALPEGMPATGAVRLIERAPALQESITEVQYRVATIDGHGRPVPEEVLGEAASSLLATDVVHVARVRKGKESVDDIRPALRSIEVGHDGDTPVLELTLLTQPRGAGPREVLDALGPFVLATGLEGGLAEHRVTRTSQWIERTGARLEPLEADAFAPVLETSAS
jgi:radical SAM-linked protein